MIPSSRKELSFCHICMIALLSRGTSMMIPYCSGTTKDDPFRIEYRNASHFFFLSIKCLFIVGVFWPSTSASFPGGPAHFPSWTLEQNAWPWKSSFIKALQHLFDIDHRPNHMYSDDHAQNCCLWICPYNKDFCHAQVHAINTTGTMKGFILYLEVIEVGLYVVLCTYCIYRLPDCQTLSITSVAFGLSQDEEEVSNKLSPYTFVMTSTSHQTLLGLRNYGPRVLYPCAASEPSSPDGCNLFNEFLGFPLPFQSGLLKLTTLLFE